MRRRSSKLSADIEVAQAKTADANERLKAIEEKLAGLDAEVAAIRKQVEEEMRADEARSKAILEEETARIVAVSRAGDRSGWDLGSARIEAVCRGPGDRPGDEPVED